MNIFVNLSSIDFQRTLGVWMFAKKLIAALKNKKDCSIVGVYLSSCQLPESEYHLFDKVSSVTETLKDVVGVELLLHHFQTPVSHLSRVVIFHDLHLWDVSWKYGNPSKQLETLNNLITHSSAVITQFPRTYFDLPRVIPNIPNALFLTISPPMIDVVPVEKKMRNDLMSRFCITNNLKVILYPAQLQKHKNHLALFKSIRAMDDKKIRLICTGSDFVDSHNQLLQNAISELGLMDQIIITGYLSQSELEAMYDRADLVVSTSLAEGGAYLAQEAIVRNKNVAISSIKPARMHLKLMEADVPIFDPLNIDDMSRVISTALSSPQQDHCRALKVINSWSWTSLADEYLSILQWVMAGSPEGEMPQFSSEKIGLALAGV